MRGVVSRWKRDDGYGFIRPDDPDMLDVFLHVAELYNSGIDRIGVGNVVDFETTLNRRNGRPMATAIKLVRG